MPGKSSVSGNSGDVNTKPPMSKCRKPNLKIGGYANEQQTFITH